MIDRVILALLTFYGLGSLTLEVLFLPARLGSAPFPISAVVAFVLNVALVWAAAQFTGRFGIAVLPFVAWVLGFLGAMFGGPGGDVVLLASWETLLLFALGFAGPVAFVVSGRLDRELRKFSASEPRP